MTASSQPSPESAGFADLVPEPATGKKHTNAFSLRAWTSLTLLGLGLVVVISGGILFCSPRGQVARWTGWRVAGLSREEWISLHINAAGVMMVLLILHVWYNWSVLWSYVRKKSVWAIHRKYELLLAIAGTVWVSMGSVSDWFPWTELARLRNEIRASWETTLTPPPVAHFEELTIAQIAEAASLEPQRIIEVASELTGDSVDATDTLASVAQRAGYSPRQLFERLRQVVPELEKLEKVSVAGPRGGRGTGSGDTSGQNWRGGGRGQGLGRRRGFGRMQHLRDEKIPSGP